MRDRKLLNRELGRISAERYRELPESGVAVVLDNVRSALNVGSVFRSADAFRVDRIYLCGITACPPSAEIHKSALGAEDSVPWERCPDTVSLISRLKENGFRVVSVEQTVGALDLGDFRPRGGEKIALVFGNEVDGVSQEAVDASDAAVIIPQWGTKHSLNISVAAGIVLWQVRKSMLEK